MINMIKSFNKLIPHVAKLKSLMHKLVQAMSIWRQVQAKSMN